MAMFTCQNCGKEFKGKSGKNPKHCSITCRKENGIKKRKRTCAQCGKQFMIDNIARDHPYCSRECFGLSQRSSERRHCTQCGSSFMTMPGSKQKFCCHKCFTDSRRGCERPDIKGKMPWNGGRKPAREMLIELYEDRELTPDQIGEMYGVQGQTVRTWLHCDGIAVRQRQKENWFRAGQMPSNALPRPPKKKLIQMYVDQRLSSTQIAAQYAVTGNLVLNWLRDYGIDRRLPGCGLVARGIEPPTDEDLERMVHIEGMTYREIAALYSVDQSAIMYWLDVRGIPRANGNGFGQSLITKDGGEVRSSYERAVADWLHEHDIDYVYEPPIPFSQRWRADFLANGWFIEIWGVTNFEKYETHKSLKQEHYQSRNLPLIELDASVFDRRNKNAWRTILAQYLICTQTSLFSD